MSITRKIAKNTSILFLSQVISYILVFFYTIYIARYLGAEGYGVLSFALAFSGIFSIITDLGLSTLTVREVARDKTLANKYLGNILIIKLILSFLVLLIIFLAINLIGYSEETIKVVYFVSISVILTSISGIFYSIFQAYEKMEYQALGQIMTSLIIFSGVLAVIYYEFNVIAVSFLFFASSTFILIYTLIIYFNKFSIPKFEFNKQFWHNSIKESLPFGLTGISGMIYTYIDSVMLSIIQGNEYVGWYNASYRIVLFLLFIPGTINIAIFPSMAKFHVSSPDSLRLMNEKYFKFMIMIGIPIAIAFTILADRIILLLFGNGYGPSIIVLQILIWTIVFTFAGAGFVRLLEATNKQLLMTKISVLSVLVNFLLNLILIPKFSLIGASIATVFTEIVLITGVFRVSYNYGYGIPLKNIFNDLYKIIISSLLMGIFILYMQNLNLLILIFLAIITYFSVLYILKGIDEKDIYILKKILNIKSKV